MTLNESTHVQDFNSTCNLEMKVLINLRQLKINVTTHVHVHCILYMYTCMYMYFEKTNPKAMIALWCHHSIITADFLMFKTLL